jgi:hypothetical protein
LVNGVDAGVTYEFSPGVSQKIELFVAGLKTFETPPAADIPTPVYTPVPTPTLADIPPSTSPPSFFMPFDPPYPTPYYEELYPFQGDRVFFSDDSRAQLICYAGSQIKTAGGSNVQETTLRRKSLSDIPAPAGFVHANYGYEIIPTDLLFLPDAALVISVDEQIFAQNPIIMRYDAGSDLWLQMPSLVDNFAGVVRASLTESGMYAVFVQDLVPALTQEIEVTKPRVPVTPPPQPTIAPLPTSAALQHSFPSSEIRYVVGLIVLIFVFNIIIFVIYKRVKRDKKELKRL